MVSTKPAAGHLLVMKSKAQISATKRAISKVEQDSFDQLRVSLPHLETDVANMIFRPIVFENPDRLVAPSAWVGHIPFAFWIIDVHRPVIFVELGTHSGNSYSAFAEAIQRSKIAGRCFAVDTWKGHEHAGLYSEE